MTLLINVETHILKSSVVVITLDARRRPIVLAQNGASSSFLIFAFCIFDGNEFYLVCRIKPDYYTGSKQKQTVSVPAFELRVYSKTSLFSNRAFKKVYWYLCVPPSINLRSKKVSSEFTADGLLIVGVPRYLMLITCPRIFGVYTCTVSLNLALYCMYDDFFLPRACAFLFNLIVAIVITSCVMLSSSSALPLKSLPLGSSCGTELKL